MTEYEVCVVAIAPASYYSTSIYLMSKGIDWDYFTSRHFDSSDAAAGRTPRHSLERSLSMSWRRGELWLDPDLLWPREAAPAPAFAGTAAPVAGPVVPPGLFESRRRRETWRRKRYARRARATAIALSPAVMLALGELRGSATPGIALAVEDPPSMTFKLGTDLMLDSLPATPPARGPRRRVAVREQATPTIDWHRAASVGLPYGGSLSDGTQLPVDGPSWVTWDPITDSRPNQPARLYGNERTIRAIVAVTGAYRAAHPSAARVVVGDISRKGGGPMDDHVSHQNGLDVDVYFPRVDGKLRAPVSSDQIDHRLAQDLVDRFVAAGAQMVFVGFSTGLRGPKDVVIPYKDHEYHMHVRFPPPRH